MLRRTVAAVAPPAPIVAATAASARGSSTALTPQQEGDRRKALIFTYYADTVDWIAGFLAKAVATDVRLSSYNGRIASLSGTDGDKEQVIYGFAPRSSEAPAGRDRDRFDLVITTDVLAEGVNLQQAQHIINYDLPWNPMRLVQRHGRIDRIGSPHDEVFLRSFFPDDRMDELLGLEERLMRKITQAARTVGVGEILPGSATADQVFTETREDIERLRAEDASFYEEAGQRQGALSGEEYRQELRAAMETPDLRRRLEALAWGSGSGFRARDEATGHVFCARVGDHPRIQFRFVGDDGVLRNETLACLGAARPPLGHDEPRVLDETALDDAIAAWEVAHHDIVASWNASSNPRALAPVVPKALRDAADIVQKNQPPEMDDVQWSRLLDTLNQAYPDRIQRDIRQTLRASDDQVEVVRLLAARVADLGLEPSPPPEPLPEITEGDVHLICWMRIGEGEAPRLL
jgi:hypothetical protein